MNNFFIKKTSRRKMKKEKKKPNEKYKKRKEKSEKMKRINYKEKKKTDTHSKTKRLMMPKCSPVRCTTLTLEQPVPENRKIQKHLQRGLRCGAGQIPSES